MSDDPLAIEYARQQDSRDPLRSFRDDFLCPTRTSLASNGIELQNCSQTAHAESCTYLCGNSLGLQPRNTQTYMHHYLQTWAQRGVYGHFKEVENTSLPPWLHADDHVRHDLATLVGARDDEVCAMQTLTANLHLAMATFYRPDRKRRYKIIIEGKAFPSDHYAIESQITHQGLDPRDAMITIEPDQDAIISTEHILSTISTHAGDTAVLLLPAIQFYTGQFFDVQRITAHAQSKGILVGWDLAHAIGNVPLHLHDHNVDFAVWCSYKYLNSGPGSVAGLFVHSSHSSPHDKDGLTGLAGRPYMPRLAGWWGSSKASRFDMDNVFSPLPGASGWQLSNPSIADLTSLRASLDVFNRTSMAELRTKSLRLTAYLVALLDGLRHEDITSQTAESSHASGRDSNALFDIITPRDTHARGAQVSIRLHHGLLQGVMQHLERNGVVVDERRPDVIRVAPAPLYNSFEDVWRFVDGFRAALVEVRAETSLQTDESAMLRAGQGAKGWSEVT